MRKMPERCIDHDPHRTRVNNARRVAPSAGRQHYLARIRTFRENWRDKKIFAHHELVDDPGVALAWIDVLKAPQNRFAILPSLFR